MLLSPSRRMQAVQAPIIPIVGDLVRSHPGTISLGQGVVWYGPPPQVPAQIARFLSDNENHKYKPVSGIPPLVEALKTKLKAENGIAESPLTKETAGTEAGATSPSRGRGEPEGTRLLVTAGGNMGFMNAVLAIADPGDEVILPTPFYFNHEMAIVMANCRPVLVPTDARYHLRLDALESAITPRTRAIVTVSPNNPTGAVYSEAELRAVNELCRQRGIYHISDEAYEYFTYGTTHFSPASLADAAAHTISLFSLSKAYGFASWRVGYMLIPQHLDDAVRKIQDTILICPPVISQFAALGALEAGRTYCQEKLRGIAEVRQIVLGELQQLGSLCIVPPAEGAFYVLLKVDTKLDAMTMVERLIKEHGVAVIPGNAFGMLDGCYLRVAYGALQKETVAAGIGRLVKGLKLLALGS
ncbi:MAG TPA: pyridoxal phosphate-dependent aminotransferase [Planctomycetota bacterium]|jgi:aspartate/methionine/tyrosine aminotransferase